MTRHSLRLRLIAGGAATIVIALAIAGVTLILLFERHVARTLADDLDVHLKQLLAGMDVTAEGKLELLRPPVDPRFAEPLSGLYSQIADDRGDLLRSRSLWDTVLKLPEDTPSPGEVHRHQTAGPAGAQVLVTERLVTLKIKDEPVPVRVAVAVDLSRIATARNAFAADLAIALTILGAILALATVVQVTLGLRPLDVLRRGVAEIRAGQRRHLASSVPLEVKPLVDEVNGLLEAREQDIERSRNRAADLAHGLKTPLAALSADGERLRGRGELALATDIDSAVEVMRRHVDRELARARLRGQSSAGRRVSTTVMPLVRSLVATLSRTVEGARIEYDIRGNDDTSAPFDRTDLAEVLGNLLDNATRHARSQVRVVVSEGAAPAAICVEDDGPGIPADLRSSALGRGIRLDERKGGSGLGLAIVQDVLDAYGWRLELERSELGGLRACCHRVAAPVGAWMTGKDDQ
jgi:signal transduction histidine kinase